MALYMYLGIKVLQVPFKYLYGQLPWALNSSGTPTYPTLGVQIQREGKGRGPLASTLI